MSLYLLLCIDLYIYLIESPASEVSDGLILSIDAPWISSYIPLILFSSCLLICVFLYYFMCVFYLLFMCCSYYLCPFFIIIIIIWKINGFIIKSSLGNFLCVDYYVLFLQDNLSRGNVLLKSSKNSIQSLRNFNLYMAIYDIQEMYPIYLSFITFY